MSVHHRSSNSPFHPAHKSTSSLLDGAGPSMILSVASNGSLNDSLLQQQSGSAESTHMNIYCDDFYGNTSPPWPKAGSYSSSLNSSLESDDESIEPGPPDLESEMHECVNSLDQQHTEDSLSKLSESLAGKLEKQIRKAEDNRRKVQLLSMWNFLRLSPINNKEFFPGKDKGIECLYRNCEDLFDTEINRHMISACALLSHLTYEVPEQCPRSETTKEEQSEAFLMYGGQSLLHLTEHMDNHRITKSVVLEGICPSQGSCSVEKPLGQSPLFLFGSRPKRVQWGDPLPPKRIFVAVQGCSSLREWPMELNQELVMLPHMWLESSVGRKQDEALREARVQKQFLSIFEGHMKQRKKWSNSKDPRARVSSFLDLLAEVFTEVERNGQIVFTGHGLGAPVAILHAINHSLAYPDSPKPIVVTFGCPSFGNAAFAGLVESVVKHIRLFRERDPVTAVSQAGEDSFTEAIKALFGEARMEEKKEKCVEEEKLIHGAASHIGLHLDRFAVLASGEEPIPALIKRPPHLYYPSLSTRGDQAHLLLLAAANHHTNAYANALTRLRSKGGGDSHELNPDSHFLQPDTLDLSGEDMHFSY